MQSNFFNVIIIGKEKQTRKLIGRLAKKKEWYKRIDKGEILGDIIKDCYDMFNKECDIIKKLEEVKDWSYEGWYR